MDSLSITDASHSPVRWVAALFKVTSPRDAPLRGAMFSPESHATAGALTEDNNPSEMGSPVETNGPASQSSQPSKATLRAFNKKFKQGSNDLLSKLRRDHIGAADSSSTQPSSVNQPTDFKASGDDVARACLRLLPPVVIEGGEALESRPAKRQRNTRDTSTTTKLVAGQTRNCRKKGGDTPNNPDRDQPAANKGEVVSASRKLRSLPSVPAQVNNKVEDPDRFPAPRRNPSRVGRAKMPEVPKTGKLAIYTPLVSEGVVRRQGLRQRAAPTAVDPPQSAPQLKRPATKAKPRQAAKNNKSESAKKKALPGKGTKGKSTPKAIPQLPPPPVDDNRPESESECEV